MNLGRKTREDPEGAIQEAKNPRKEKQKCRKSSIRETEATSHQEAQVGHDY